MTLKPIDPANPPMKLSPQQQTALWLYASDLDIQQVADLMGITRSTAKVHLHRAYNNIGTKSVRHAVKVAYEIGIFTPNRFRGLPEQLDQQDGVIEEQERILAERQQLIERASEGVTGKVLVPESVIAAVQTVAMQLATMSHVTNGAGLAAELRAMSNKLDGALRELGAATVESPVDGATRALEDVGLRGVNRVFIGVVLEDHPEVKYLADEWDWSDTEVRDKIAQHVVCDMLGLSRTQYEQAIHADESRVALMKRFWEAHKKWT